MVKAVRIKKENKKKRRYQSKAKQLETDKDARCENRRYEKIKAISGGTTAMRTCTYWIENEEVIQNDAWFIVVKAREARPNEYKTFRLNFHLSFHLMKNVIT